jgi:type II secretory ATPase GspE/PulE/Tfp pilus assembly ATPase PilB-like protein
VKTKCNYIHIFFAYDLIAKDLLPGPLEEAPAARMFDIIMIQAIRDRASDIHFEPDEKSLRVRLRIDGFLYEFLNLPSESIPRSHHGLRS